jgi:hypothetical protein
MTLREGSGRQTCKVCTSLMKVTSAAAGHLLNPHLKAVGSRTWLEAHRFLIIINWDH